MRKPGPVNQVLGNPVTFFVIALAILFVAYEAWVGQASWVFVLVLAVIGGLSQQAGERLDKYHLWKLEWDAMGGDAPRRLVLPKLGGVRLVFGFIAWGIGAIATFGAANQPGMQGPIALYWLGSVVLFGYGISRALRKSRPKIGAANPAVAICLPVPRDGPTTTFAFQQLPEHCLRVLDLLRG